MSAFPQILKSSLAIALLAAGMAILGAMMVPKPEAMLDWDGWVVPMALDFAGLPDTAANRFAPIQGKIIVITGATNGIGLSLTEALSRLGATVVAIGRNKMKLQVLQNEIPSVLTFQANLGDLSSVAQLANKLRKRLNHIDVLVNNAGIHDGGSPSVLLGTNPRIAKDPSMDLVFVTNYLSHFLLTDKLLGLLKRSALPKVVQTSSTYHWGVDGTDLVAPATGNDLPIAARSGGSHGFYVFRSQRSYANSKLAQILHARVLQRMHPELRAVSVCPAWVGTGIAGPENSTAFWAIHHFGYRAEGWGIASSLYAILDNRTDMSANDFYSNSRVFKYFRVLQILPSWSYKVGLRDLLTSFMDNTAMIGQHFFSAAHTMRSSPESYDMGLAKSLYDWSTKAVANY